MRSFLFRTALFSLPVALAFLSMEVFVRITPNAFSGKAIFLHDHLADVRCLVLGSSHNQSAINPDFMSFTTANIAYSGQDERLDSALLKMYLPLMPQLKMVLIECDYHSLEEMLGDEYFRYSWYYHFYNIDNGHVPLFQKVSLYASEPQFFNDLLKRTLTWSSEGDQFNRYGFIINDFPGPFLEAHYDSILLEKGADERLKLRHKTNDALLAQRNAGIIRSMVHFCLQHNVKPVLIASPMYSSYILRQIPEKVKRRGDFLESMQQNGVLFLDYEKNARFKADDFKNDDHLNPKGAEKFTRMLNDTLVSLFPLR